MSGGAIRPDRGASYHEGGGIAIVIVALVAVIVVSFFAGLADEHDVNNRPEQPTTTTGTDRP